MQKLKQNLTALMNEVHLDEAELARRTGLTESSVIQIISGEINDANTMALKSLAEYFGITISQLIGDQPMPAARLAGTHTPHTIHGKTQVPVVGWEQVSAWVKSGSSPTKEFVVTDIEIGTQGFALKVTDSNLEPHFPADSILLIDPDLCPKNQSFAVVQTEGETAASIKQIAIDNGSIYLQPLNTAFKTIALTEKHKVLGPVVQLQLNQA